MNVNPELFGFRPPPPCDDPGCGEPAIQLAIDEATGAVRWRCARHAYPGEPRGEHDCAPEGDDAA